MSLFCMSPTGSRIVSARCIYDFVRCRTSAWSVHHAPFDQELEVVAPASSVNTVDSSRVVDINCQSFHFVRRVVWKPWEGRGCPQGCVDFGIAGGVRSVVGSARISSHDINRGGWDLREACLEAQWHQLR